ncbi:MAG: MFS transporter [Vicinamibacterales bacterium]
MARACEARRRRGWPGLRSRDIRLLCGGQTISILGSQVHAVALPWLVLDATGSGTALGAVLMVAAVPRALLMMAGGAVTDRVSPRRAVLWAHVVRALLVAGLAMCVSTGTLAWTMLLVIVALMGTADALFYPAYAALIPRLVPKEQLVSANAVLQGGAQAAGLAGPALGGFVVASCGVGAALALDAATFVVAAATLGWMGRSPDQPEASGQAEVRAPGVVGQLRWHPEVRSALLAVAVVNFAFVGPFTIGVALVAHERLAGGPAALGWVFSALGAGALLGSLVASSVAARARALGRLVAITMALVAGGLACMAFVTDVRAAMAAAGTMGAAAGVLNPTLFGSLQGATDGAMRGRVMGLAMLGAVGLTPLSYALAGLVAARWGASAMFAGAAAVLVAALSRLAPRMSGPRSQADR